MSRAIVTILVAVFLVAGCTEDRPRGSGSRSGLDTDYECKVACGVVHIDIIGEGVCGWQEPTLIECDGQVFNNYTCVRPDGREARCVTVADCEEECDWLRDVVSKREGCGVHSVKCDCCPEREG